VTKHNPLLVSLLALTLVALTGCSRCSRSERAPAPPTGQTEASPTQPAAKAVRGPAKATPAPDMDRWPGLPVDVMLQARAPLLDAAACDDAIRPVAAALRGMAGVEHLWSRAQPGRVRLLVRFATGTTPAKASAQVLAAWQADAGEGFGPARVAGTARGSRAIIGYTLVDPKGRQAATVRATGPLDKLTNAMPGVTRTALAGAVRKYSLVQIDPVALANHGITFGRFHAAIRQLVAADSVRVLNKRLEDATLKRAGTDSAKLPPATMDRLTVQTGGIGEPLREAQVGGNLVTTLLVHSGHGADLDGLFKADTKTMRPYGRKLQDQGGEFISHNLTSAHRFILSRSTERPAGSRREFGQRLVDLLKGGGIYDALVVDGVDGIPEMLDDARPGAKLRTMWLMLGNRSKDEEVLDRVQEALAGLGWRAHLMHDAADVALMWLLGRFGTAGMVVSSRDPGELNEPTRVAAEAARQARSAGPLKTGPRAAAASREFATLERATAMERRVAPVDLARIHALVEGPTLLGTVLDEPVWLGLPTESMAVHVARLPLRIGASATTWAEVQRLPGEDRFVDRLRADGEPALWLMVDSALEGAETFTAGFWQMVERLIEPAAGLRMRPLRLDHRALGGRP